MGGGHVSFNAALDEFKGRGVGARAWRLLVLLFS